MVICTDTAKKSSAAANAPSNRRRAGDTAAAVVSRAGHGYFDTTAVLVEPKVEMARFDLIRLHDAKLELQQPRKLGTVLHLGYKVRPGPSIDGAVRADRIVQKRPKARGILGKVHAPVHERGQFPRCEAREDGMHPRHLDAVPVPAEVVNDTVEADVDERVDVRRLRGPFLAVHAACVLEGVRRDTGEFFRLPRALCQRVG